MIERFARRVFILAGLVLFILPLSASAALDHLVISQVQISGTKADDDFIELFNPTSSAINLAGLKLVSRSQNTLVNNSIKSWGTSTTTTVPSFGFYLWVNSKADSILLQKADLTTSDYLSPNYGVAILDSNDNILDNVAWGDTNNGFDNVSSENPGAGKTLLRQDLFSTDFVAVTPFPDGDSRNSQTPPVTPPDNDKNPPTDDTASSSPDSASTTPESQADYLTKSNDVKIYRFLPNPAGEDAGNEWVELKNSSSTPVLLDGWLLDDDDKDMGVPGKGAFTLSGLINAGEIKRFILSGTSFALNNSGGDEVNLYFSDKTLAHTASYTATAPDDGIFEFRDGLWQPPPLAGGGGGGGGSSGSSGSSGSGTFVQTVVQLLEFLPNPAATDQGKEWVEFYNPSALGFSLAGYILDDEGNSEPQSSSLVLDNSAIVPARGYLVVTIPEDKFSLNNSGKDTLRFFDPNKNLVEAVAYENAPEGKSYLKNKNGKWEFGIPTPGKENSIDIPPFNLIISEILPNPKEDQDEFIEIFNPSEKEVTLTDFVLQIGSHKKIFDNQTIIKPKEFLTVFEDDLPSRLRNSGQTVTLFDFLNREVSKVTYPPAKSGLAYATLDGKNYLWTASDTAGEVNEIVLGESIARGEKEAEVKEVKLVNQESSSNFSNPTLKQLLKANEQLQAQLAMLQESVTQLSQKISAADQPVLSPGERDADQNEKSNQQLNIWAKGRYLVLAVVALILLIVMAGKYLKTIV